MTVDDPSKVYMRDLYYNMGLVSTQQTTADLFHIDRFPRRVVRNAATSKKGLNAEEIFALIAEDLRSYWLDAAKSALHRVQAKLIVNFGNR
jgi:hypothetical protein